MTEKKKVIVEKVEIELFNSFVISKEEQEKRKQQEEERLMEKDEQEAEILMSKPAIPETIARIIELTQKHKHDTLPDSQTRFNHNPL